MTSSAERRVAKLETRHGIGARTFVVCKDQTEPYERAIELAGIEPRAEDLVIVTNYFFGDDGLDAPGRRVLAVW